ncbi:MAG TPA: molecular chaperone DnaJ [Chthonomonadaceae bacterium]|nr:molecular chaperone DnaJ [Chthonomonadaceae bacterium]
MATQPRDYYEVLGVSREATPDELKRAYRNLAKKYHPDINKAADAADRFKEIQAAYDVLSDEEKRRQYDRYGHEGLEGVGGFPGGFGMGGDPFSDLFDIFMGQATGRRGSASTVARGDDLREDLELNLEEVATGVEKKIKFSRMETCDSCHGSGAQPGTDPQTCSYCRGTGQIRTSHSTLIGTFHSAQTCPHCRGTGHVIANPCNTCRGSGRTRKTRERTARIPAGVDTGMRIKLNGEGDAGERGGPHGDLYLVLYVREHPVFERRGNDLYCEVPISYPRAALGDTIEIPVLGGKEDFKIPEGTQSGQVFTLRGRGIPDINGRGKGDLNVAVQVKVPTKLTAEQRELLKQLAASLGEKVPEGENRNLLGRLFGA